MTWRERITWLLAAIAALFFGLWRLARRRAVKAEARADTADARAEDIETRAEAGAGYQEAVRLSKEAEERKRVEAQRRYDEAIRVANEMAARREAGVVDEVNRRIDEGLLP